VTRSPRRVKCNGEVEVVHNRKVHRDPDGTEQVLEWDVTMGLCASCSERETENRNELRAASSPDNPPPRASRRFGDA